MSLAALGILYTTTTSVESESQASDSEHVASDPYLHKSHPDSPQGGDMPAPTPTDGMRIISAAELSKHSTREAG